MFDFVWACIDCVPVGWATPLVRARLSLQMESGMKESSDLGIGMGMGLRCVVVLMCFPPTLSCSRRTCSHLTILESVRLFEQQIFR